MKFKLFVMGILIFKSCCLLNAAENKKDDCLSQKEYCEQLAIHANKALSQFWRFENISPKGCPEEITKQFLMLANEANQCKYNFLKYRLLRQLQFCKEQERLKNNHIKFNEEFDKKHN